jgi:hypothetical protein
MGGLEPPCQEEPNVKKTVLDITVLVVLILAFAIAGRLLGGESSMLPWNW